MGGAGRGGEERERETAVSHRHELANWQLLFVSANLCCGSEPACTFVQGAPPSKVIG